MYSQNNLWLIDVSKLHRKLEDALTRALPGYHAISGCDYAAAFYRKEKVRPFKRYLTKLVFKKKINEGDSTEIEKHVPAIYDRKRLVLVDKLSLELCLKKYKPKERTLTSIMKNFDRSQLPPCARFLK